MVWFIVFASIIALCGIIYLFLPMFKKLKNSKSVLKSKKEDKEVKKSIKQDKKQQSLVFFPVSATRAVRKHKACRTPHHEKRECPQQHHDPNGRDQVPDGKLQDPLIRASHQPTYNDPACGKQHPHQDHQNGMGSLQLGV